MKRNLDFLIFAFTVATVVALVIGSGAAAKTSRAADEYIPFHLPLKNIYCAYSSSTESKPYYHYLRCDILSGLKKPTPSDKGCVEGTRKFTLEMDRRGKARYGCVSDSVVDQSGRVLKYGTTWKHDGFTCHSSKKGLRCNNLSGHGFFMSRAQSKRF